MIIINYISPHNLFLIFIIFNHSINNGTHGESEVIVRTKNGQIKGKSILFNNQTINSFIGIRYGEPPVGELRFVKSKPVRSWNGTYDATNPRHSCWQRYATRVSEELSKHWNLSIDEDCLFLNIWTPSLDLKNSSKTLYPVMFWIHGGGFLDGSSYLNIYNGTVLSTYGVVMVSINYRLGVFGFISDGTNELQGNAGLWDMVLALKWVNDNIESFGGDPNRVTIFGESAGSIAVGLLIVSPLTKGLFKRGIMQSGSPYMYIEIMPRNFSLKSQLTHQMGKHFGCDDHHLVNCLKNINAKNISDFVNNNPLTKFSFWPSYGDQLIPHTAKAALQTGNFLKGTDLMVGVNEDEGTLFLREFIPQFSTNKTFTKSELKVMLKTKVFQYQSNINFDKLYHYYLEPVNDNDQINLKKSFSRTYGDYLITCPTYFFAKEYASHSSNDSVHFYYYTHKQNNRNLTVLECTEQWMGVCHGEELPFTFGYPKRYPQKFPLNEQHFSNDIIKLWTNFAKTGDPLSPQKINSTLLWPSFRENDNSHVIPKAFTINPNKFGILRPNIFNDNCDGIWKQLFNQIN